MPGTKISAKSPRRNLLKLLGLGGVAAANLPAQWSKPVVNSVLLPIHAQTSPGEDGSPSECSSSIVIPGFTLLCTDSAIDIITLYVLSFSDGCLTVETSTVGELTSGPDRFSIRRVVDPGNQVMFELENPGGSLGPSIPCDEDAVDESSDFDFFNFNVGGQQFDGFVEFSRFSTPTPGVLLADLSIFPVV